MTDPVAEAYDRLAETYDDTYSDEVSAAEDRRALRALRPEIERAKRVVDVGCGTGWTLDHLSTLLHPSKDRDWTGFDISPGMLKRLVEKHPWADSRVQVDDINTWNPEPGAADLVLSGYASPSYAKDQADFLRRCRVALREGGRVFLMPHAPGDRQRTPYLSIDEAYIGDTPWTERKTHDLLEKAGFCDIRITGMRHPTMGPGQHRGRLSHDAWLSFEQRLFRPDAMVFLVITATANGG